MPEYRHIQRQFGPVYDENSKILILGSFPSVKSREVNFFYGHPQNRFWPLMARVLGCAVPQSIEEKKAMLLANGVALWDVLDSCDIAGSSDSSIRNAVPVDIALILRAADIRRIYCNGTAAYELFMKHLAPVCGMTPVKLPSTSPANAAWSVERLLGEGIAPEELIYYGLEYKFVTRYVIGEITREEMYSGLEIAIHQFAKRQMTWFRGMERRGFHIHWLPWDMSREAFTEACVRLYRGEEAK